MEICISKIYVNVNDVYICNCKVFNRSNPKSICKLQIANYYYKCCYGVQCATTLLYIDYIPFGNYKAK